ncbi:MAG: HAMP domain-containing histidine kinase [Lachnospiraceae bacterium]|nr:HAMP domain-containing histidine kinase [Lachnospiraceae bacterium]
MKHTERIGRMVFITMTLSFAVILLFVHFFLRGYVRKEAARAIGDYRSYVLSWEQGTGWSTEGFSQAEWSSGAGSSAVPGPQDSADRPSMFQVLSIETDSSYAYPEEEWASFTGERSLLAWCAQHKDRTDEILYASVDGREYYLEQIPFTYSFRDGGYSGISIACVNISAVIWMIQIAEIIMAVLMVLCIAAATWMGCSMDRSIRLQRERQKQFFENASHELKTPLMSIQGYAEALSEGVTDDPAHASSVIIKETRRMARLVDDILLLSRYDRGSMALHKEKLSVAELVGDCVDTLSAAIKGRGLTVETDIRDRFVMADEEYMTRAVLNILSNALRYAKNRIRITFDGRTLAIWDDGDPLPPKELEAVFDRFHTGKGGSTGIGLALSREILTAHGYTVAAQNHDGGVRFLIDLNE